MHYPLIDKTLLPPLRLAHGSYSLLMMLLFFYQGWLGLMIRRARRAGGPLPFSFIKRHRRSGPLVAGLGVLGYVSGLTLIMLDTGNVLEYAPHFFTGSAIVLSIFVTVIFSNRIRGQEARPRDAHAAAGAVLLFLYGVNSLIGIGVLL